MNKSVKSLIYKGNIINFIILSITNIFHSAALIVISLMLEKIMAIATAKDLNGLIEQGIMFAILLAATIVCYIFVVFIKPSFQKKAINQYKNNIYSQILNKSITDFNAENVSTYISVLTNDVTYIETNYLFSQFDIISNVLLFIASVTVMLLYSPILTLAAIGLSLLPLISALLVGSKLSYHEKVISDQNASFMHFIKDNLIGFSTIKVFKAEKKFNELFEANNNTLETKKASRTKTTAILEMVQTLVTTIAQFGVFFIGAYISIKTDTIAPSVIILFVQLMNFVMSPLMQIPSLLSKRLACLPLFKKIDNILNANEIRDANKTIIDIENITISNVSFSYGENQVLNNINYKIEKNKSYALVGMSGSGKSTLMNLLLGKEINYEGNIYYGDNELREISLDSLFEVASLVEQNVFVFDDSIINNITMYSQVDEKSLNEAIIKSGLSKLIEEKGADYRCGENGCNLSGGEKQRISIARALVKKTKLLLLDEATSALDNETSTSITNNLLDIDNTTKIMITHRLDETLLKHFDEIIVMKNGLIVESGNYDELIENNSTFKSLVEFSK